MPNERARGDRESNRREADAAARAGAPGGNAENGKTKRPRRSPRLNLATFEKKIIVRQLRQEDLPQLQELYKLVYPAMDAFHSDQLQSQLEIFPEGQIGVELNGSLIAMSSSLIIDFDIYTSTTPWRDIADNSYIRNHNPEGDTLYGIDIIVHPQFRGMKLSRRMYDARKLIVRQRNLMRFVIGGRIPNYHKYSHEMSAREYVDAVVNKSIYDPVLTAQLSNGFTLKRLIPDYYPEDKESRGYATFLEWTNLDWQPDSHKRYVASRLVRICAVQYQMRYINSFQEFATQCEYFVDAASEYQSDFVVFPEMLTVQLMSFMAPDQPAEMARHLSEFTPQYLDFFTGMAIKYNVNIIGGSHFTLENDQLYNIAYLFKRNGEIEKQYKLHITPSERKWWGVQPGDTIRVIETDKGPVNIQICYDIEFPEISRIAVEQGARIIFTPFCTDERSGYLRVRYCSQARCIENQIYTVIAGTVGNLPFVDSINVQYAQSGIFTPSDFPFSRDAIAAECTPNVETLLIHDLDLETLRRHRLEGSVLNWKDRRLDLYEVVYKRAPAV